MLVEEVVDMVHLEVQPVLVVMEEAVQDPL